MSLATCRCHWASNGCAFSLRSCGSSAVMQLRGATSDGRRALRTSRMRSCSGYVRLLVHNLRFVYDGQAAAVYEQRSGGMLHALPSENTRGPSGLPSSRRTPVLERCNKIGGKARFRARTPPSHRWPGTSPSQRPRYVSVHGPFVTAGKSRGLGMVAARDGGAGDV